MRLLNISGPTDLCPTTKKKKLFLINFSKLTLKALSTFIVIFNSSQIYLHISAEIHTQSSTPIFPLLYKHLDMDNIIVKYECLFMLTFL